MAKDLFLYSVSSNFDFDFDFDFRFSNLYEFELILDFFLLIGLLIKFLHA